MGRDILLRVQRWLDIGETTSAFGRALLEVRYRTLQRQIPIIYAVALANILGLHLATGGEFNTLLHPANLLILFVIARLVHWTRARRRRLEPEAILGELRKTFLIAGLFSACFCYWAIDLLNTVGPMVQNIVILFASLAAIGCAYGLSSFPSAARLPLLLFALPMALRLVASGDAAHIAVGISLGLVTFLLLRLLSVQSTGFTHIVRSRSEIDAERQRAQKAEETALAEKARVKVVADSDPLTGLANRRAFLAALEGEVARPGRSEAFAIVLVDLDGFKPVNDTFGHAAGDAVLGEVGRRLTDMAGAGLVARMGGDEFAMLIPACSGRGAAERLGRRIGAELKRPYVIDGREFRLSGGCGLHLVAPGESDVTLAISRCDTALYSAKQAGRGEYALFTSAMEEVTRRRSALERALRDPDVHRQIGLVFQPIYNLATMELRSFEALARWEHPELGPISPGEFIPITEQINAVEAIAANLLTRAAAEAVQWPEQVRLSFNLSAVQLCSASAAPAILACIAAAGLDPRRLQLEVTETALLVDFVSARHNLRMLRRAGARIILDDFGAGFASISYLREIDFDKIKLDGSLIVKAADSPPAMRLLRGVVDLCASLGVPCIAEHIETEAQLALLRQLNCGFGQGYLLAQPLQPGAARELAGKALKPPAAARIAA